MQLHAVVVTAPLLRVLESGEPKYSRGTPHAARRTPHAARRTPS